MEQVVVVRIIDAPQKVNGETCGVFADQMEHQVVVTDTSDTRALERAIGRGVLAARGPWEDVSVPQAPESNATVIGAAFSASPPIPLRRLDL